VLQTVRGCQCFDRASQRTRGLYESWFVVLLGGSPEPAGFASLTVADFPVLFTECGGNPLPLRWRGSCDGFGACGGRAPIPALIRDRGNIFGGFTPVKWESSSACKADPSLKTLVFMLKNPHNFPARKSALRRGNPECFGLSYANDIAPMVSPNQHDISSPSLFPARSMCQDWRFRERDRLRRVSFFS
jgi:hypothetical protein